jgi:hypothetical protein
MAEETVVRILGLLEATALLKQVQQSAVMWGHAHIRIGTNKVYAWGIEFGRRRNGQLARKVGGAFMLTDAYQAHAPNLAPTLAANLPKGPQATWNALVGQAMLIRNDARQRTPVVSGDLKRSIQIAATGGPGGQTVQPEPDSAVTEPPNGARRGQGATGRRAA